MIYQALSGSPPPQRGAPTPGRALRAATQEDERLRAVADGLLKVTHGGITVRGAAPPRQAAITSRPDGRDRSSASGRGSGRLTALQLVE